MLSRDQKRKKKLAERERRLKKEFKKMPAPQTIKVIYQRGADASPNCCIDNVQNRIDREGGEVVYGLLLLDGDLWWCLIHHAVWKRTDGELRDITPYIRCTTNPHIIELGHHTRTSCPTPRLLSAHSDSAAGLVTCPRRTTRCCTRRASAWCVPTTPSTTSTTGPRACTGRGVRNSWSSGRVASAARCRPWGSTASSRKPSMGD
jgi:hypothetical protein